MSDLIERQKALEALNGKLNAFAKDPKYVVEYLNGVRERILQLPSAEPEDAVMFDKETILQAGYKNREVEFRVGGRLFRVREVAQ